MKQANIVLIPGFMLSEDLWTDIIPLLPNQLIIHHAPLIGNSISEMALETLKRAPEHFVLCGFSMGGYVAREIVRLAPERVIGLIIIASSSRAESSEQIAQKKASVAQILNREFVGLSRSVIAKGFSPDNRKNQQLIERVQTMSRTLGKAAFIAQSQAIRHDESHLLRIDKTPTLVIAAELDELRPIEESRELVAQLPDAKFVCISDSGHMIPLEQPIILAKNITDWCNELIDQATI
ncbi:alpha/beta fold hydrolase [Pseudomonas sp. R5(2019)]|uniref:alpha/beta fold hydrolase n=1 Tax=Pseudomonas sp. R5(2019) TaxID=2697566 RepID=UPI0014123240|nr:alpha/beta hydrolase [Pseudomonas sp. R5(2019)]NBA93623.1 alpha/beta fold hydrolase [Pseudomonas sp. R5(2019)]